MDESSESEYDELPLPLPSSSEEESDSTTLHNMTFKELLGNWLIKNKITHRASSELLHMLVDAGLEVDLDRRTMCNTVKCIEIVEKCGGEYVYIGLRKGIEVVLSKHYSSETSCIIVTLDFGIDGIPIFKSTKSELWPILARFGGVEPFLVSCYYGRGKPSSAVSFLSDFLHELTEMLGNEYQYEQLRYRISVRCFVADAPARSFLKGTVSHTGYHSCERCTIVGTREADRVVLLNEDDTVPRTDEQFRELAYHNPRPRSKCHQHTESPLVQIPDLDLLGDVVLDSMHMVYLGIMRRILFSFKGKIRGLRRSKLRERDIREINARILSCKGQLPSEFNRQPRSLDDLKYWKATELRSFLLYTSMVVLKGIVNDVYNHLMHLSMAITLLSSSDDNRRNANLEYSRRLLRYFRDCAQRLYEDAFVVYNVHCVVHIPDDVEKHNAPLHEIDAFGFENQLKSLKQMIRGPQNPLSQVYRQNEEKLQLPVSVKKGKTKKPRTVALRQTEKYFL